MKSQLCMCAATDLRDKLEASKKKNKALSARNKALTAALRELVDAEWMVTHDWGGDRRSVLEKAMALCRRKFMRFHSKDYSPKLNDGNHVFVFGSNTAGTRRRRGPARLLPLGCSARSWVRHYRPVLRDSYQGFQPRYTAAGKDKEKG